jgi:hypothetical protein
MKTEILAIETQCPLVNNLVRAFSILGYKTAWCAVRDVKAVETNVLIVDSPNAQPELNVLKCAKIVVGDFINTRLNYDLFCHTSEPSRKLPKMYKLGYAADSKLAPKQSDELKCQVAVIAEQLNRDEQIIVDRLCYEPYRVRISTNQPTYNIENVGRLNTVDRANLLVSTDIVVTNDIQTIYDTAYYGGFAISFIPNQFFPTVDFNTIDGLAQQVRVFLGAPRLVDKMKKNIKQEEIETYVNRAAEILVAANLGDKS